MRNSSSKNRKHRTGEDYENKLFSPTLKIRKKGGSSLDKESSREDVKIIGLINPIHLYSFHWSLHSIVRRKEERGAHGRKGESMLTPSVGVNKL